MSATHTIREYIAPYEMVSEWDEILQGDEELFKEMTEPHVDELLRAARRHIDRERRSGNIGSALLEPEELVAETLIDAWEARHGRNERRPLKDWLLEMQKQALRRIIVQERKLHEPIAVSLEESLPDEARGTDENELWEWGEPLPRDRWEDVIPDEAPQAVAA